MNPITHQTQTSTNRPLYQSGDRGAEVSVLQQYLAAAGYSPGKIDGIYGAATVLAVQKFQQANGIPADGVVWLDTFNALANAVNEPAGGQPSGGQQLDFNANLQPDPNADQQASGGSSSGFPQWAIYLGVAAAGAIALYFLSTKLGPRFTKRSLAEYGDDDHEYGCSCEHQRPRKAKRRLRS